MNANQPKNSQPTEATLTTLPCGHEATAYPVGPKTPYGKRWAPASWRWTCSCGAEGRKTHPTVKAALTGFNPHFYGVDLNRHKPGAKPATFKTEDCPGCLAANEDRTTPEEFGAGLAQNEDLTRGDVQGVIEARFPAHLDQEAALKAYDGARDRSPFDRPIPAPGTPCRCDATVCREACPACPRGPMGDLLGCAFDHGGISPAVAALSAPGA